MALDVESDAIAIVGMAVRVPGASDMGQFWANLTAGTESITTFDEAQLRAAGTPEKYLRDPNYVMAAPVMDDVDSLDAAFFGITPREAELLDPQHRIFLEICATALQHAGYDPAAYPGRIGIYAGAKENIYLKENVEANAAVMRAGGELAAHISNNTDYLATGVAYRLNLRGPAINVVTACSTSLVATHLACRGLRAGECDIALAGGVEIILPVMHGYLYYEGGILAPDAHVRPFDANARGTVFGSGAGTVVLKRLRDALADRDTIHAVILGSAVNNDGSGKGAFSAPSKEGQVAVIKAALRDARVEPHTIGYVEAHGTGTLIGDPIEVAALSDAFGDLRASRCAIASVKGNVGHLGAAAGICGLVKAALCVRNGQLPPSINFTEPNPRIDFAASPFYVQTTLASWPEDGHPRRAGVSSFGIGGTNAHVVIEQAPAPSASAPAHRPAQLLTISAQSMAALDAATAQLGELLATTTAELADVAHTLNVGRTGLPQRRILVAESSARAAARLAGDEGKLLPARTVAARSERAVAFLFPGQGSQYPGMARGLYESEPAFAAEINRCAAVLADSHGLDLPGLLFPAVADDDAGSRLNQTAAAQPALFAVEYALARLLAEWGVTPAVMAGHSIGEYVAAVVAGVLDLEDALRLVADRGVLMQSLPRGLMLAVTLSEEMLSPMLPGDLDLAAVNAPGLCVVSGPDAAIRQFRDELAPLGVGGSVLHTSHAFHSRMMDPILEEFRHRVGAVRLHPPAIPYVSNLTGKLVTASEATDPEYWVSHLRNCVRFSDSLRLLGIGGRYVFLEAGPGRVLSGLVAAHADGAASRSSAVAIPALRQAHEQRDDVEMLLESVGRIWSAGAPVDWDRFWAREQRRRVTLPTYPYERRQYWVEPDPADDAEVDTDADAGGPFYLPTWRETASPPAELAASWPQDAVWVVFARPASLAIQGVVRELRAHGAEVLVVEPGAEYAAGPGDMYTVRVNERADYERLFGDVAGRGPSRVRLIHAWCADSRPAGSGEPDYLRHWLDHGFFSVLTVVQEAARQLGGIQADLSIVTTAMQDVLGDGSVEPAKAAVLGLVKVAAKEFESVRCRSIDFDFGPDDQAGRAEQVSAQLLAEVASAATEEQVAYRGRKRWAWSYTGVTMPDRDCVPASLTERGRYVITGGLGGLGLLLAGQLARLVKARLVLIGRTGLPDRQQWPAVLAEAGENDPVTRRIRSILEIEKVGGEVLIFSGDVADEARMREIAAEAGRAFGGIDGVFHLAATPGGGMLETRPRDAAEAVFSPKVAGLYVIEAVFRPALLVLYSSIAVVNGDFGLGDYIGANAVLDAFAAARWAEGRHVVSISFPPWAEAGMAFESVSPAILLALTGSSVSTPVSHPLLAGRQDSAGQVTVFDVDMSPERWVLAEHKLNGTPTMPGTGVLELVRAACAEVTGDMAAEIRDLKFLRPLAAAPGARVRLELRGDGEDGFEVAITGDGQGPARIEYARGKVRPRGDGPAPSLDLGGTRGRCATDTTPAFASHVDVLQFGPRWDNIASRKTAPELGLDLVTIQLPAEFAADLAEFVLHPAIMDSAGAMGMRLSGGQMYLPFGYDKVVVHAPVPARCHAVIRHRGKPGGEIVQADVSIVDDDGSELVGIEGYTLVRYDSARGMPPADPVAAPEVPLPAAKEFGGISPAEGAGALRAVLGTRAGPAVIFCPEGVAARGRRARQITRAALLARVSEPASASTGERNLDTPYVEPRSGTERALASLWCSALWLDKVGVEDDFFDLGGNSLVAVQLAAQISSAFKVDVAVAQLFELRTVRAVAGFIEQALLERVSGLTDEQASAELAAIEAGR